MSNHNSFNRRSSKPNRLSVPRTLIALGTLAAAAVGGFAVGSRSESNNQAQAPVVATAPAATVTSQSEAPKAPVTESESELKKEHPDYRIDTNSGDSQYRLFIATDGEVWVTADGEDYTQVTPPPLDNTWDGTTTTVNDSWASAQVNPGGVKAYTLTRLTDGANEYVTQLGLVAPNGQVARADVDTAPAPILGPISHDGTWSVENGRVVYQEPVGGTTETLEVSTRLPDQLAPGAGQ